MATESVPMGYWAPNKDDLDAQEDHGNVIHGVQEELVNLPQANASQAVSAVQLAKLGTE